MVESDLYLMGAFLIGLVMSILTGAFTWRIARNVPETSYIELNISPATLKDAASEAVYDQCHTLVMPVVAIDGNQNRTVQVAFVDQRLRLEATYNELFIKEDDDDDGDYVEV